MGVIWGMSGASSGACLGQSKISAVLHASLLPFFLKIHGQQGQQAALSMYFVCVAPFSLK